MTTVDRARADDLDALLGMAHAFYDEDGFATPRRELRGRLEALISLPSVRTAVARTTDDAVGFAITTTTFGLESGLVAELEDLYVVPSARRAGVGSLLVDDSVAWATSLGVTVLEVIIAPNGQDVTHLHDYYARSGFLDEGRRLVARPLT